MKLFSILPLLTVLVSQSSFGAGVMMTKKIYCRSRENSTLGSVVKVVDLKEDKGWTIAFNLKVSRILAGGGTREELFAATAESINPIEIIAQNSQGDKLQLSVGDRKKVGENDPIFISKMSINGEFQDYDLLECSYVFGFGE